MTGGIGNFEARMADGDDRALLMAHVEIIRAVCIPPEDFPMDRLHEWVAIMMSASAIVAGNHFGTLAAIGVVNNDRRDRKKAESMLLRNFRSGIDLALGHAAHVAQRRGEMQ